MNKATYIGTVQNVSGTSVSISLNMNYISGETFVDGEGYKIGQVGSFIKIPQGYEDLIGIITQIGANAVPERLADSQPYGNRWMTIQLIGETNRTGKFERGISQYPIIGDEVHLVTEKDLRYIYGNENNQYYVCIGNISGSESIPALVDINKLLVRHSAIVGSTGTGKSTTVASILSALSDSVNYPSSRILVLDIHGEYGKTFAAIGNVYKVVNSDMGMVAQEKTLYIPYWAMSYDDFINLTLGTITDNDKALIGEMVLKLKRKTYEQYPELYPRID